MAPASAGRCWARPTSPVGLVSRDAARSWLRVLRVEGGVHAFRRTSGAAVTPSHLQSRSIPPTDDRALLRKSPESPSPRIGTSPSDPLSSRPWGRTNAMTGWHSRPTTTYPPAVSSGTWCSAPPHRGSRIILELSVMPLRRFGRGHRGADASSSLPAGECECGSSGG